MAKLMQQGKKSKQKGRARSKFWRIMGGGKI
jgi:hypothetical protein